jgi:hypothetical protein
MKKTLVFVFAATLAASAFAQGNTLRALNAGSGLARVNHQARALASSGNLVYHPGGRVIRNAHVVMIFWGSFPGGYTTNMQNFRNQFGTTGEYNVITQYGGIDDATGTVGLINLTNLGGSSTPDYFDPSTPPTNVTDTLVQAEVRKVIRAQGSTDYSAIYEVFIPSSSYSSDGTATSCGGPNLTYCSYHSYFTDAAGKHVKYSIQPWEGCAGCKAFNNASLDEEHFVCHETREAVMNPVNNAWFDPQGNVGDDLCAWSPPPFIGTGGFGYQYEWSNLASGCVKSR